MDLKGRIVLVTGGTGSFGRALLPRLLEEDVKAVRVLSRDELKQSELRREVEDPRLRLFLGDVRDLERLRIAFRGVDVIFHAAALKQVPALEYDPFEAVKTNVLGTQNVITAAIEAGVSLVVGLSTDKAVAPTNLYGATKLTAERLLQQAGVYSEAFDEDFSITRFAAVRYGNVVGSRGSVVPLFREQAKTGAITITDERMTRFWITLPETVDFVLSCIPNVVRGGEVFVPKIPSAKIVDIASAIAPDQKRVVTGIRPGEKLHETLLTEDEARRAVDLEDRFVIEAYRPGADRYVPRAEYVSRGDHRHSKKLPDGFRYSSDTNDSWLTVAELRDLVGAPAPLASAEYPY